MGLSDELISQFAKITKDDKKTKSETTVYGTVVEYNGKNYVKLDGSELLTPVSTTTNTTPGDRVTVLIKNHSATVTGNITSPSAKNSDLEMTNSEVKDVGSAITKFEIVLAGKVDTTEFNAEVARIDTLSTENATIKNTLAATNADIGVLQAKDVNIEERLTATEASIQKLEAGDISVETLKATFATVENLNAVEQNVVSLEGDLGDFKQLTADDFTAVNGAIDELDVNKLGVTEAKAVYATIANLNAATADITSLESSFGSFQTATSERLTAVDADIEELNTKKISATDIEGKFANIDFSNIGEAAIEAFISKSGLIENAVIGDGTVTGRLVGVTIKGDLIEAGTLVADKLVMLGTDGLYYKLNTNGVITEAEQTNYNSINGSIITAQSITASKISVDDLVAFDATIGGFKITEDSLYSGVKSSVENTTRGIYLDNTGQMSVGDSTNYIRYYKDSNGNYKLAISADELTLSSENKSVATAINELSEANQTNSSDLANYMTVVNSEMASMQGQIDGSIMTHFYEYEPTNTNIPANEWTTVALKNNHLGDLFYDTITGYCYRWQVQNNTYSWNRITDVDVTKALADAHAAQETANNKRRVFTTTPTTPYDVGDLWVQGTSGDILKCQTAKTSNQSYAAADWAKASKYTDDTAANAAQADANALKTRMSTAETRITENAKAIELRATKTEVTETLSGYYTKEQADSNLTVKANEISTSVASTYATKSALNTTNNNVTAAQNTANSAVSKAENAQADIDNFEVGGSNLLFGSRDFSGWLIDNDARTTDTLDDDGFVIRTFDKVTESGTQALYSTKSPVIPFDKTRTYTITVMVKVSDMEQWYATNNLRTPMILEFGSSTNVHHRYVFVDIRNEYFSLTEIADGWYKLKVTIDLANTNFSVSTSGKTIDDCDQMWIRACLYTNYGPMSLSYKKFKMEYGTAGTDWSPNPEEVKDSIDGLDQRVTTAETTIVQNTNDITLAARRVNAAITEMVTDPMFQTGSDKVNGVILNAACPGDLPASCETCGQLTIRDMPYMLIYRRNMENHIIRVSAYFYCHVEDGVTPCATAGIGFYQDGSPWAYNSHCYAKSDEAANTWVKKVGYYTIKEGVDTLRPFIQQETETGVTTNNCWYITGVSIVDITAASEYSNAQLKVEADSIKSSVSSLGGRLSTVEQTSTSLTSRISDAESDIVNTQTELNGLEIGGTNLCLNSGNLSDIVWGAYSAGTYEITYETDINVPSNGVAVITWSESPVGNGGIYINGHNYLNKIKEGEEITVSLYQKFSRDTELDMICRCEFLKDQVYVTQPVLNTEWQRVIVTGIANKNVVAGANAIAITFYYGENILADDVLYLSSPKIEKGNRATDWSPAPEDIQNEIDTRTYAAQSVADEAASRISTAESVIEQLVDSISTLVQDENGTSLMTQTETGWVFSVAEIQNGIDKTSEDLNTLVEEVGTVDNAVQVLQQAVDDLGILGDYIHIGLYEDEPCIELGELDSDFKVLITNTRIMFKEGSSTPTYISNQTLITEKINVTEELKQGNFVWSVRSNGNYGLIWKEG